MSEKTFTHSDKVATSPPVSYCAPICKIIVCWLVRFSTLLSLLLVRPAIFLAFQTWEFLYWDFLCQDRLCRDSHAGNFMLLTQELFMLETFMLETLFVRTYLLGIFSMHQNKNSTEFERKMPELQDFDVRTFYVATLMLELFMLGLSSMLQNKNLSEFE